MAPVLRFLIEWKKGGEGYRLKEGKREGRRAREKRHQAAPGHRNIKGGRSKGKSVETSEHKRHLNQRTWRKVLYLIRLQQVPSEKLVPFRRLQDCRMTIAPKRRKKAWILVIYGFEIFLVSMQFLRQNCKQFKFETTRFGNSQFTRTPPNRYGPSLSLSEKKTQNWRILAQTGTWQRF